MKYMCLVYGEEQKLDDLTKEEMAVVSRESLAYDRTLETSGHLIMAEALRSVATAKSVRKHAGKKEVTDGPFAETKEQLLGFVLVEAKDLAEALDLAADIPLAKIGTIEVRAIYDLPDPDKAD